jgi:hypothetical protein
MHARVLMCHCVRCSVHLGLLLLLDLRLFVEGWQYFFADQALAFYFITVFEKSLRW